MKNLYRNILFIPLILLALSSSGQTGQLRFNQIDIYDGLSHNQVNCIFKDQKGFMWFGTFSGLDRYDGYSFKVFRHDIRDTTSLIDSYISEIYELPENKLWIQTRTGSNVYDPATESFNRDENTYLQSLSLPKGEVNSIFKDKQHDFWFVYNEDGLYRYSSSPEKTAHIHYLPNNSKSLSDNNIAAVASDNPRFLWIVHSNGILEKVDKKSLNVIYRNDSLLVLNKGGEYPYRLFMDRQGDLWIYVKGKAKGLFYFDVDKKEFQHITTHSDELRLNNNVVYDIVQDEEGLLWIGTDHGGINLINKDQRIVRYLMHNPEDRRSLSQNSIYALYRDVSGMIWVGTYKKGICYYNEAFDYFPLISHDPNLSSGKNSGYKSLPYEDVNRFIEDKKGNLWIGTNGGGLLYYNRRKNTFKQYKHNPDNPGSLCNDIVVGLCLDSQDKLWIGTYMGGLDCFDGKTFIHYRHIIGDSSSLSNNSVWDIYEDAEKNLWVGTLGGGLDRFDRKTEKFIHYKNVKDIDGISYVMAITADDSNNLWIGTAAGIEVMNPEKEYIHYYQHIENDTSSLSNDNINAIYPDSRGWIWIATREGLNLYDPVSGRFRAFTTEEGLPINTVLTLLEDHQHRIWMSTPDGISCLTISNYQEKYTFSFKNYSELDGLQGREFNDKAALKTREGELIFGGSNGFNLFNPTKIKRSQRVPPVVLTDFQIFNKSVKIGEKIKKQVILPWALSEMKAISIPYAANDFSIVFAALGYDHTGKNKYAYKLKGFNDHWMISDDKAHKVTFTNLDPGDYTFMVKASNSDGKWGKESTMLQVKVLPPFWMTSWAYILYALLILAVLYFARSILLYRARMKFKIEHQQHEARRIHELDMMKIRFFTNISHEFRTPLSLILTPLDKVLRQTKETGSKNELKLIQRNAKRLLHLVNQLLDFRKLEVQEIRLNPVEGDIVKFIKEVVCSFTDIAEKKNVRFLLRTAIISLQIEFDPDKMERILFNLLSNAFKFTPEYGRVLVSLEVEAPGEEKEYSDLIIRVRDNGIGIPEEKQKYIFKRFFQHEVPPFLVNPGSGIGLSITHEFVRLHKGNISVKSAPGKGSCFTIRIPIVLRNFPVENPVDVLSLNNEQSARPVIKSNHRKPTLLLIEDNEDFRFYLKDNLSVYFNVLEAASGKAGWEKVLSQKPDLIVSDIMMPGEMNGIQLSKRAKRDPRTAAIPIILLTAHASAEQRLEGYETGANDYITKPFNFEILLARIYNLLEEQKRIRGASPARVDLKPKEIKISSEEDKFVKEAIEIVEKNIDNPQFSVKELSNALYMSRVTLHKKISEITGESPSVFIRKLRLKRAAQLIEKGNRNVSQAAYEVGYNNPKYFTKHFKEEFRVLPSEYGKKKA